MQEPLLNLRAELDAKGSEMSMCEEAYLEAYKEAHRAALHRQRNEELYAYRKKWQQGEIY